MKKYCFVVLSAFVFQSAWVSSQGFNQDPGNPNLDFSSADFSNWQLSWGAGTHSVAPNPEQTPGPGGPSTHVIVENIGNNWDGNAGTGNLPKVPSGLNRVARLGHPSGNGYGSPGAYKLKYDITVSSQYPILFFQVAAIMDKTHAAANNTHYKFLITDASGTVIPSAPCTNLELFPENSSSYNVGSAPPINYTIFHSPSGANAYQKWESIAMDLGAYSGQTLTLSFIHYDCNYGYHGSYHYLSAAMRKEIDTVYFCKGSESAVIKPYIPRFKSYLWSTGSTADSIVVNNPVDGATYTCTVGSYNDCDVTFTYVLKEDPIQAGFNYVSGGCNEVVFTDASSSPLGSPTGWEWNFGDPGNSSGTTSTSQHPSYIYSDTGSYQVTFIAESPIGCKDTVIQDIQVISEGDGDFTFSNACLGASTLFTDVSSGNIISHQWSFGDGNTSTEESPAHIYASTGTYNVTLITENSAGCTDTIVKPVTIHPSTTASFSVPAPLCDNKNVLFTNTSANAETYSWSFGNGEQSGEKDPSQAYTQAGNYTIELIAMHSNGCADTVQQLITVAPSPTAAFTASPLQTTINEPQVTFLNQSQDDISWYWNFGDGETSTLENPMHHYTYGDIFNAVLIVANQYQCTDTAAMTITVLEEVIIPNVFTPNGDGVNDVFWIKLSKSITDVELIILNRWGELVFHTDIAGNSWDGTVNGKEAMEGVYFYKIKITNHKQEVKELDGFLTLER